MASGNLPPQRREIVVRGDGNCFYRAIALWRDETSDKKHEEIRRLSSSLIEKNPKVFEPLLFASNSVEEHVKNSKITGTWAETVDIFSCASLLKRPFCTFSTKLRKWFSFKPIVNIDSFSSITTAVFGASCLLNEIVPLLFLWTFILSLCVYVNFRNGISICRT